MRRIIEFGMGSLLILVSVLFGYVAIGIGRNVLFDLSLPPANRMTGYGGFGIEFTGWQMWAVPLVCTLLSAGFLSAGLALIFRRRDSAGDSE